MRAIAGIEDDLPAQWPRVRLVTVLSLASLLVALAALVGAALVLNRGTFVYALDDAYIHLAMAKTLALDGTYGLVAGQYESASSSPGWTALLAALTRIAPSANEWFPLIVNGLASCAVVACFAVQPLFAQGRRLVSVWLVAALLPIALYLPVLVLMGMEHALHTLLVLLVLLQLQHGAAGSVKRRRLALYCGSIGLATLLRFETAFVAAGCAAALVAVGWGQARDRHSRARVVFYAIASVASAAVPIAALGALNLVHGQYFLPNSVLAKSSVADSAGSLGQVADNFASNVSADPMLLMLLAALALALFFGNRRPPGRWTAPLIAVLIAGLLHLLLATTGWFDRYQAYLIAAGMFVLLGRASELLTVRSLRLAGVALLAALILVPALKYRNTLFAPLASNNTYSQQYQLGRFFAGAYAHRAVAANDIGALSFLHPGRVIDLIGLADNRLLRLRLAARMDAHALASVGRRERVAAVAVYDCLFHRVSRDPLAGAPCGRPSSQERAAALPDSWTKVGQWTDTRKRVYGLDDTVSFYAPRGSLAKELARQLRAFVRRLPPWISTRLYYSARP
jgi:hypothetical protein